jgi:hypothetical protein
MKEPHSTRRTNAMKCQRMSTPGRPFSLKGGDEYAHIQKMNNIQKARAPGLDNKATVTKAITTKIRITRAPALFEIRPPAIALK